MRKYLMDVIFGIVIGIVSFCALFFVITPGSANIIILIVLDVVAFLGYMRFSSIKKRFNEVKSNRVQAIFFAFAIYNIGLIASMALVAMYVASNFWGAPGLF
ncbi:MAG TPA: hypothetical protein VMU07_03470 [Candidatus Paceibacterota bacterium]|nr:hypothetical protein [Candidatus Paceibacterota bacterium]